MAYAVELIWSNNAQTTIANSISNTATTVNLASGTGILFPSPGASQGFTATFTDQGTGLLHEIVLVTNRTGDTVTMVRGQEGTTPLNWTANDLFAILWTSGAAATLVQQSQLQEQSGNYGLDTGSVNAYIVALNPVISSAPAAGTPLRVKIGAGNTNTAASTMDAGWGAVNVVRRNGSALIGGELVAARISQFIWNGTTIEWQGLAPTTSAAIIAGTDTQSAVTPAQLAAAVASQRLLTGQCYFQYVSATQCKLVPFNGNGVPNAGTLFSIAAAGITVANTSITLNGVGSSSLGNNANYLVAFNASGQLEFWTIGTGHSPSATAGNIGVEIVTGHNDKTLVGMVRTNGSGQFVDTDGSLFVLSWFNRKTKRSRTNFTGNPTVGSVAAPIELDTSIRNTFIVWSTADITFNNTGTVFALNSSQQAMTGIGFDGTTPEQEGALFTGQQTSTDGNSQFGTSNFAGVKTGLSEGNHYATLLGAINVFAGNAAVWQGGTTVFSQTNNPPTALTIIVQG